MSRQTAWVVNFIVSGKDRSSLFEWLDQNTPEWIPNNWEGNYPHYIEGARETLRKESNLWQHYGQLPISGTYVINILFYDPDDAMLSKLSWNLTTVEQKLAYPVPPNSLDEFTS